MLSPLPKLAAPARRALEAAKVLNLKDLERYSLAELTQLHGMGPKAMAALTAAMVEHGFKFRDEDPTSTATRTHRR